MKVKDKKIDDSLNRRDFCASIAAAAVTPPVEMAGLSLLNDNAPQD